MTSTENVRVAGTELAAMPMRMGRIAVVFSLVLAPPAVSGQEASTMKIRPLLERAHPAGPGGFGHRGAERRSRTTRAVELGVVTGSALKV